MSLWTGADGRCLGPCDSPSVGVGVRKRGCYCPTATFDDDTVSPIIKKHKQFSKAINLLILGLNNSYDVTATILGIATTTILYGISIQQDFVNPYT